jgi:hypothetical protein
MLSRYHMFNMESEETLIVLMDSAVLAPVAGASSNQVSGGRVNHAAG